jgi:hypothetical protein
MPTICRKQGYRVVIYTNDHRPAHVHVIKKPREAVFTLHCPHGPPELRESKGMKLQEVNDILDALTDCIPSLCGEWRKIHGHH